ncbi:3-oxoacyl-[acyl-carrier-protein] reductase FabG [Spirochaetia bacterium]|nr:3-oxoacyl-[acyl-carrier-protein] reductase FabG [Spirochaetia bacterium]
MDNRILYGKVCVITGTIHGIGQAIAEKFAEGGAIVYAGDYREGSLNEWARNCSDANETKVIPVYFDVTDSSKIKQIIMDIYKEEGKLDCLVNNAGVISNNRIGMITKDDMEKIFRVNVFAVIDLIQTASRIMSRNKSGSIINIASIVGVNGSPGQTAYSASKGAVIAMTKSAAKELAPMNIRVNAVAPGIIETERFKELYKRNGAAIDTRIEKIGLGRLGTPIDVANACVFLASDSAGYISGQILGVDGCAVL